jgi:GNAT superfamily N-acetyltransferase
MSTTLSFRDGLASDIPACMDLDHAYETDFVWQMRFLDNPEQREIIFQRERLPRLLESSWPKAEHRLKLALGKDQCFLVVEDRQAQEIMAYLTMRNDPVYHVANLQDLVVSRPYRRRRIGSRLLQVARSWARQRELRRLTVELQTQNFPGILFCQRAGLTFCGFNDHYFPNQDIAVFFSESLR